MKKSKNGFVYSTNPNFEYEDDSSDDQLNIENKHQNLRIYPDRKNRKGKTVTVITGYEGSPDEIKSMEKKLKSLCGSGGTVKDGDILLQGNFVQKIAEHLKKEGFNVKISGV